MAALANSVAAPFRSFTSPDASSSFSRFRTPLHGHARNTRYRNLLSERIVLSSLFWRQRNVIFASSFRSRREGGKKKREEFESSRRASARKSRSCCSIPRLKIPSCRSARRVPPIQNPEETIYKFNGFLPRLILQPSVTTSSMDIHPIHGRRGRPLLKEP